MVTAEEDDLNGKLICVRSSTDLRWKTHTGLLGTLQIAQVRL